MERNGPAPWEVNNLGLTYSSEPPNGKMAAAEIVNPERSVGETDCMGNKTETVESAGRVQGEARA